MKWLRVLCVVCSLMASAFSLDRSAFTFTNYDLKLRVEPEQQRLAVRGKITLRNDSNTPQRNLSLQISSSLDWRSISVDGKPAEFVAQPYISDIDHTGALSEALVSLPQPVAPKATVELDLGYEGVVLPDTTRLVRIGMPEDAAKITDWDEIGKSFSAVRGIGHVVWYPVETDAASLSQENAVAEAIGHWTAREAAARMRVELCLWKDAGNFPSTLMNDQSAKASNGKTAPESDGSAECHEHVFAPLGQTVPLFVIGRYETLARGGVSISYWQGHKSKAENYSTIAAQILPWVTSWFGSLRQDARFVEIPTATAAPYESGGMLLTPLSTVDAKLAEITAVHQLAHAAFPSPRQWVYEGLAHFAQAVYKEQHGTRGDALQFMSDYLPAVVQAEKSLASEQSKVSPEQSLTNTGIEELYRSKAMYVWWMLRDMLGETVLKQALSAYQPDHDTQPSYLQQLLQARSKRDLAWFFDDWVYHDRGLPDFRIDSVYPSQTSQGSYMVTVTVENLGDAGAEVPITVATVTQRLEVRAKSKASIRIVVPALPSEVVVNDGSVPESDMSNNRFVVQKQ